VHAQLAHSREETYLGVSVHALPGQSEHLGLAGRQLVRIGGHCGSVLKIWTFGVDLYVCWISKSIEEWSVVWSGEGEYH
jgi:hypothetical protein